jgi:hypothetical protein
VEDNKPDVQSGNRKVNDGQDSGGSSGAAADAFAGRPFVVQPCFSVLPAEITERPQWMNWRQEWDGKKQKWVKIPFVPFSEIHSSSTNPKKWRSFEIARKAFESGKHDYDGIGFALENTGLVGADLDNVYDPATGAMAPWAEVLIRKIGSYTEFSALGRGVHILAKGKLPDGLHEMEFADGTRLEAYDAGRYFTATGQLVNLYPGLDAIRQYDFTTLWQDHAHLPLKHPKPAPKAAKTTVRPAAVQSFDLHNWLTEHHIPILTEKRQDSKVTFEVSCIGSHGNYPKDDGKAFVIQFPGGRLYYGCQHSSCPYFRGLGNHWRQFYRHYEPPKFEPLRPVTTKVEDPAAKTAKINWKDLLLGSKDKEGNLHVMKVLTNALTVFRFATEWQGVLGFSEFSLETVTRRATPWGTPAGSKWRDVDDSLATEWMQKEGVFLATKMVAEAVEVVAQENCFHPVREFLASLVWDKVPRLDEWLITYLGCTDSQWVRTVGPRWLISAVARIFHPGCQADYALMLEGPQGIRKSSAIQALGVELFSDHVSSIESKDARLDLRGKWIIELGEMGSIRRGDLERVKAFLNCRNDYYRDPYGRRPYDHLRQNVFVATSNLTTPFTDPSGNRRFWPVRCGTINVPAIEKDRTQLLAEAVCRYQQGEVYHLDSDELNKLAEAEQEERYEPGVYDEIILDWIKHPAQREAIEGGHAYQTEVPVTPWYRSEPEKISVSDVLIHCLGKPKDRLTQADQNQVARCLQHAKYERKKEGAGEFRGKWFYHKKLE